MGQNKSKNEGRKQKAIKNQIKKEVKRKEIEDQDSDTWITSFHYLLSNASSLEIHQSVFGLVERQ
jgi:hypothetical protein